jgi:hypothetical protein
VGVLRAACEGRVFLGSEGGAEIGAERLPARPKAGLARPEETGVGEVARAEAGEADQTPLLLTRRRAAFLTEFVRKPDRCEIVQRPLAP